MRFLNLFAMVEAPDEVFKLTRAVSYIQVPQVRIAESFLKKYMLSKIGSHEGASSLRKEPHITVNVILTTYICVSR